MLKAVIATPVLLIALAAYWWLYDQDGANEPISITYDLEACGKVEIMNLPFDFHADGTIDVCARPDAVRISVDVDCEQTGPIRLTSILRVDTNVAYTILPDEEVYCVERFDLVPKSQTESPNKDSHEWYDIFEEKVDAKWIGEGEDRYFIRRHLVKKIEDLPKNLPTPKWILWLSRNLPDIKFDMWFTSDTRIGSRYVDGMNKLLRIKEGPDSDLRVLWLALPASDDGKRPQIAAKCCPYFPVPLRIQAGGTCEDSGTFAVTLEARRFSRRKVSPCEFEPPEGFTEISVEELEKKLYEKNPILGIILKDN